MANYTKKLDEDLKAARKLLDEWIKNPADVFVKYGLADKPNEFKATSPKGAAVLNCSCGCVGGCEYQKEAC